MNDDFVVFVEVADYHISFAIQKDGVPIKFNSGVVSFAGPLNRTAVGILRNSLAGKMNVPLEELVIINIVKLDKEAVQ